MAAQNRFLSKVVWCTTIMAACAMQCRDGHANTVDLSGFPDGTPISANNPYNGVIEITGGQTSYISGAPGTPSESDFCEAVILHAVPYQLAVPEGVIQARYSGPFLAGSDTYVSDLKFTFLQPVTDISFGMASFRGGGYHYTATDAAGDLIFGNGGNPNAGVTLQFGFLPFSIDLPSGYYFTDFHIGNGDYTTANGAVWVDDISFTTAGGTPRFVDLGDPVPDQASTFLLLSLAALALYGSKRLGLLHS